jgi:hypothetical protein
MLILSQLHYTLTNAQHSQRTTDIFVINTFKLLLAMKTILCAPHARPNGRALSCGADDFQVAENETSSC